MWLTLCTQVTCLYMGRSLSDVWSRAHVALRPSASPRGVGSPGRGPAVCMTFPVESGLWLSRKGPEGLPLAQCPHSSPLDLPEAGRRTEGKDRCGKMGVRLSGREGSGQVGRKGAVERCAPAQRLWRHRGPGRTRVPQSDPPVLTYAGWTPVSEGRPVKGTWTGPPCGRHIRSRRHAHSPDLRTVQYPRLAVIWGCILTIHLWPEASRPAGSSRFSLQDKHARG